ncbi:MAG: TolC family protein [Elusimicrobia bacterium]|nr:TolC family protein [Elusimicrobiota bacterium]
MYGKIKVLIMLAVMPAVSLGAAELADMSLENCIAIGIKNNIDIRKANISVLSAKELTNQKNAQYEPGIRYSVSRTDSQSSGANPIYGSESRINTMSLGLNKKLSYTGGVLGLDWKNEKTDSDSQFLTFNPLYDTELTLSYSQPLLNNAVGINDQKTLKISKMNEEISILTLKNAENRLVNQIEKAYFSLGYAVEYLRAQKESLDRSKELLEINRKKFKDGLLEEVDIIATEAVITVQEASILLAEDSVTDAKDQLKKILGIPVETGCSFATSISTKVKHVDAVEQEVLDSALKNRPDYRILENMLNIDSISEEISRNGRLPDLALVTSYGLNNTAESYKDNYESISSRDNPSWYVGLDLRITPFNRLKNSLLRQSGYTRQITISQVEDKKAEIEAECRNIARRVNTQYLYLKAARRSLKLQKKKLKLEKSKFDQGRSSIQWVLAYEDDLSNSNVEYYKALTEYHKALSDLKMITGETR